MTAETKADALTKQAHAAITEHVYEPYGDTIYQVGGLFEAYVAVKPSILAFLAEMAVNESAMDDLFDMLEELRLVGILHKSFFDNLLLSFAVNQESQDSDKKSRVLSRIDEYVRPRQTDPWKDMELVGQAFLFARLKQHGASFNKCSEVLGRLGRRESDTNIAKRSIERKVAHCTEYLERNPQNILNSVLDCIALCTLCSKGFSMQEYFQKHYKKTQSKGISAFTHNFITPYYAYLCALNGEAAKELPREEKIHECDKKMESAIFQLLTQVNAIHKGTV